MTDALPEWYPLANATDKEINSWLTATTPPYDEMRAALPWLDEAYQFDAWIAGLREARAQMIGIAFRKPILAGVADIPLPPRRLAGRMKQ